MILLKETLTAGLCYLVFGCFCCYEIWPPGWMPIKLYWHPATAIHSHIVSGCFHATIVALNSIDRDCWKDLLSGPLQKKSTNRWPSRRLVAASGEGRGGQLRIGGEWW